LAQEKYVGIVGVGIIAPTRLFNLCAINTEFF
jgi:hypothetical protein